MSYALLIPGWFPTRVDFLTGDFIERHAAATSVYYPVKVLFVVKDQNLEPGRTELDHRCISDQYEQYIFYYSSRSKWRSIEKLRSVWMQSRCLIKGFRLIRKAHGLPSLIHAHVLLKHAWFALRLSRRYHIPLLASEQWTGYLPEARGEFNSLTKFQRNTIAKLLKHAVHLTTVSDYLARKIGERFHPKEYSVIPNLVQMDVFCPAVHTPGKAFSFIHVSTLSAQKNAEDLIKACGMLKQRSIPFSLHVVGPEHPEYREMISRKGLEANIIFHPEMSQPELAKLVAACDALILYSNYETFGCVIVEANACGLPVIVSDFPVFYENVDEGVTGIHVPLHQPEALAKAMASLIESTSRFDREAIISNTRRRYSAEVIGEQFGSVYRRFAKP